MEDINNSLDNFIESVENKEDINVVNNNLSLLVAQLNIFYYKNNFFNNISNCNETNPSLSMQYLETVSQKVKDIYPKYMELKNDQYQNIYIRNLKCDNTNSDYTKNIDKTNKIHNILNDITDLLEFNENFDKNITQDVAPVAPIPVPVVAQVVLPEAVPVVIPGPIVSPPIIQETSEDDKKKNYKTLIIIFGILALIVIVGISIYIYIKYLERKKLMNKTVVSTTTSASLPLLSVTNTTPNTNTNSKMTFNNLDGIDNIGNIGNIGDISDVGDISTKN